MKLGTFCIFIDYLDIFIGYVLLCNDYSILLPNFYCFDCLFLTEGGGELSVYSTLLLIYGSILIMIGAFLSQLKRYSLIGTFPLIQSKGTN